MQEIWKDIKGYEGIYQISNLGRVKILARNIINVNGKLERRKEKIKKNYINWQGYSRIGLCKKSVVKKYSVHILVAKAFIPNPENKPEVNHKYGIKTDNRATELEWSTKSENMLHAYGIGLNKGPKGNKQWMAKLVIDTQTGIFYDTISEAAIAKNINQGVLGKYLRGRLTNKTSLIFA
jgi:hypothetical protein